MTATEKRTALIARVREARERIENAPTPLFAPALHEGLADLLAEVEVALPRPREKPLFLWKLIDATSRAQFLSVAIAETEAEARTRLLAYGQSEIIREYEEAAEELDDDELEARVRELKTLIDACEVTRLPMNMPGIVCWAECSF